VAINYFVAQKYTEALAKIGSANNQKVILMPFEASSLIGTLGGIGSIAKDLFSSDSQQSSRSAQRPVQYSYSIPPKGDDKG